MILIIDDDRAVQASLRLLFRNNGLDSTAVSDPEEALAFLKQIRPELIMLDMNFSEKTSGIEGLALLKEILALHPSLPIVLITGWATLDLAIAGMKAGAKDFISKPWTNEHMIQAVQTLLSISSAKQTTPSRKKLDKTYHFEHIIGEDPAFLKVLDAVGRIASTNASVLILGESGTGKELIAEALHQNSLRKHKPFVKVNLGGISSTLFESEMFGHKRGAFTDAKSDRKGRFEMAHKGTIFLDEIGELDLFAQVKLLRVLQDRSYEILGSSKTQQADVRVISAANRNLAHMVGEGTFREDLYYRINLITIQLPTLRERPQDIPLLVDFYLQNVANLYHKPKVQVSTAAMNWLQQYAFPGNIRQLKNLVERTVLISSNDMLEIGDFQAQLNTPVKPKGGDSLPEVGSMSLEEIEKEMIIKAMTHHQNKITQVAKALGITRSALYRRLEKYNIRYD